MEETVMEREIVFDGNNVSPMFDVVCFEYFPFDRICLAIKVPVEVLSLEGNIFMLLEDDAALLILGQLLLNLLLSHEPFNLFWYFGGGALHTKVLDVFIFIELFIDFRVFPFNELLSLIL